MSQGWGTLDELFEVLTWAQLGIHTKPCALLNVLGYFDPLLAFMDHSIAEGFVRHEYRRLLLTDIGPERLLARLDEWAPPVVTKWIARSVR